MTAQGPYRICFVCSGNICRSPMAEVVMRAVVEDAGLAKVVLVDSAGTGDWHIGERADGRAVSALADGGYDGSAHRARQFEEAWFASHDLIVALDRGHYRTLRAWAPTDAARTKVHLLRSFDPALDPDGMSADLDIADPYYQGTEAFAEVLEQIEAACAGLLERVRATLTPGAGRPSHLAG